MEEPEEMRKKRRNPLSISFDNETEAEARESENPKQRRKSRYSFCLSPMPMCAPCPFPCLFFVCIATCCSQLLSQPLPPRQGLHPSIGIGLVSADRCATRCATVSVDVFDSFAFFSFCVCSLFLYLYPLLLLLPLPLRLLAFALFCNKLPLLPPLLFCCGYSLICVWCCHPIDSHFTHTHTHTRSLLWIH